MDRAKSDRERYFPAADSPATAPELDSLWLNFARYDATETLPNPLEALCPALSAQWAQRLCDGRLSKLMLGSVTLASVAAMRSGKHLAGIPSNGGPEIIAELNMAERRLAIGCRDHVCLTALRVTPDLVFIWSGGNSPERAEQIAEVLAAFLHHAMGPVENFAALLDVLCRIELVEGVSGSRMGCKTVAK